jgi:hypothetical protein
MLALLCALASLAPLQGALPPAAEVLLPSIQAAERRLQDASLQLESARRAAQPQEKQVTEARRSAGTWWGSWLYQHRLGQLKDRLDSVESARVAQASARQELSLLLNGADEEMSTALEASLSGATAPGPGAVAQWRTWWRQKRAWQERLAELEPQGKPAAGGEASRRIQEELGRAQVEREKALLESLCRHKALSRPECAAERERLEGLERAAGATGK